jgi:hypothetical protein
MRKRRWPILPYGGFDAIESQRGYSAEPWDALRKIHMYLYLGLPVPPALASWLGNAIEQAQGDPKTFLRLLGLARPRGKTPRYQRDAWLKVGARLCDLQDEGMPLRLAIEKVCAEMPHEVADADERTLRRWRDTYRRASEEAMRYAFEEEFGDE